MGIPYFLPRKWVKATPELAYKAASDEIERQEQWNKLNPEHAREIKLIGELFQEKLKYRFAVPLKVGFDFEKEKQALIDNLDYLFAMSVQEQTLYKKWLEWNEDLHASYQQLPALHQQYDKIWKPKDINDKEGTIAEIEGMQPYVELVGEGDEATRWTYMRKLISSMEFTPNPGRNVKGFVKDRTSGKVLGVISLGSDITSLGVRDEYIGWTKEDKFEIFKATFLFIRSISKTLVFYKS